MSGAFYIRDGDRFTSTDWARGPWDPNFQHAGPPAALLARSIERLDGAADFAVARFTVEIMRSVPITTLTAEARLTRPGRSVQLAEATLSDGEGRVAVARAWRVRRADTVTEQTPLEPPPFAGPTEVPAFEGFDPWNGPSYFSAVEWRLVAGEFLRPGPATVWMRMRGQLVEGEDPSPLTRVLVAADSGNGVSMELSMATHIFVNTELTVHLFRPPRGEWICLDARTRIGPEGAGLAGSVLYDADRRIGAAHQALLVRAR
jgi:hypothetical protein